MSVVEFIDQGSWSIILAVILIVLVSLYWILGIKSQEKHPYRSNQKEVRVFYATQTGISKRLADELVESLTSLGITCSHSNISECDPEDTLTHDCSEGHITVFLVSTYTNGAPPDSSRWFFQWIHDSVDDCRVQKSLLSGIKYAIFGVGNSLYEDHYNMAAKNLFDWLGKLSAHPIIGLGLGDQNVSQSRNGGVEEDYKIWKNNLLKVILPMFQESKTGDISQDSIQCSCGKTSDETCTKSGNESGSCKTKNETEEKDLCETSSSEEGDEVIDMEDIGGVVKRVKRKKHKEENIDREMVTPIIRQSLTKQGYRVIGSHSGVKLCRWTKSMLRGRGGCYKHTFYGIESHRCMETTPSLACANKCVFCWRHHTNPVGTEWKWKMDNPDIIVQGALENHYQMIKQFRGVPGVKPERLSEGMHVKHCALSLVGEPIMYPEINRLITLLHEKHISTFLVTNAQFPDAIRRLLPVTQLYVSVDASTKESLKRIDRPLFKDYWPRFTDSLEALAEKGQRTVYRLTLVKQWNTEELEGYAELVARGNPDFIEVKGVTYCGDSKASNITMANVPWHEEVLAFVQELSQLLPNYQMACEHEHSNCVLLAHRKFLIDGRWHTWIDYSKFHQLLKQSNGATASFTAMDYVALTPEWCVIGSSERGFDPMETRWIRKNKKKDISGC